MAIKLLIVPRKIPVMIWRAMIFKALLLKNSTKFISETTLEIFGEARIIPE